MVKSYSPYLGPISLEEGVTPIIVFTVGKVGSKTIVESIYSLENIPYAVFHAHVLSSKSSQHTSEDNTNKNFKSTIDYLTFGHNLSNYIRDNFDKHNWKVITLVREPLSIILSTFFEFLDIGKSMQSLYPEIFENGKLEVTYDKFLEFYSNKFSYMTGDYVINWFDLEMKPVFNIDVFDYPFDTTKGYSIVAKDNVELLTIRLEDLNKVFPECINDFLGIREIKMIKDNIGNTRHYSKHMQFLKDNLSVFKHVANHFFSSKFTRHFYASDEMQKLIEHWTRAINLTDADFRMYDISRDNIFEGLELWEKE